MPVAPPQGDCAEVRIAHRSWPIRNLMDLAVHSGAFNQIVPSITAAAFAQNQQIAAAFTGDTDMPAIAGNQQVRAAQSGQHQAA